MSIAGCAVSVCFDNSIIVMFCAMRIWVMLKYSRAEMLNGDKELRLTKQLKREDREQEECMKGENILGQRYGKHQRVAEYFVVVVELYQAQPIIFNLITALRGFNIITKNNPQKYCH
jgi:hypothetical protein